MALLNGALLALLDGDSLPLPLNACGGIGCEVAPPFLSLRCGGTYSNEKIQFNVFNIGQFRLD